MEKPSPKTIEITIISPDNLRINKKPPAKQTVSVIVKADPFNSRSTGVEPDGGSYPSWNEKLIMEPPAHARFTTVEAHSGRRVIETASIPVWDFSGGHLPENYLSFLSDWPKYGSGQKNGIINQWVKVSCTTGNKGCAASCSRPWMAVPAADGKVSLDLSPDLEWGPACTTDDVDEFRSLPVEKYGQASEHNRASLKIGVGYKGMNSGEDQCFIDAPDMETAYDPHHLPATQELKGYLNGGQASIIDNSPIIKMNEANLGLAGQGFSAAANYILTNATSPSPWVVYLVTGATIVGVCGAMTGIALRRKAPVLSNRISKAGAMATASGIIVSLASHLPPVMAWTVGAVALGTIGVGVTLA